MHILLLLSPILIHHFYCPIRLVQLRWIPVGYDREQSSWNVSVDIQHFYAARVRLEPAASASKLFLCRIGLQVRANRLIYNLITIIVNVYNVAIDLFMSFRHFACLVVSLSLSSLAAADITSSGGLFSCKHQNDAILNKRDDDRCNMYNTIILSVCILTFNMLMLFVFMLDCICMLDRRSASLRHRLEHRMPRRRSQFIGVSDPDERAAEPCVLDRRLSDDVDANLELHIRINAQSRRTVLTRRIGVKSVLRHGTGDTVHQQYHRKWIGAEKRQRQKRAGVEWLFINEHTTWWWLDNNMLTYSSFFSFLFLHLCSRHFHHLSSSSTALQLINRW